MIKCQSLPKTPYHVIVSVDVDLGGCKKSGVKQESRYQGSRMIKPGPVCAMH